MFSARGDRTADRAPAASLPRCSAQNAEFPSAADEVRRNEQADLSTILSPLKKACALATIRPTFCEMKEDKDAGKRYSDQKQWRSFAFSETSTGPSLSVLTERSRTLRSDGQEFFIADWTSRG